MVNKPDFMSLLRRDSIIRHENEAIKDIRAVITLHGNTALLAITDASLRPVELEANNRKSTHARLISACRRVTDSMALSFDWTADYSDTGQIPIAYYPFLVPLLVDCADILVDSSGCLYAVYKEAAPLHFILRTADNHDGKPRRFKGDFTANNKQTDCFLSDQYVTADNEIRRVRSIRQDAHSPEH